MAAVATSGSGGCLCGAVRYHFDAAPRSIGLCQCRRCQRQSGSAFLIGVVFAREAVSFEGVYSTYEAGPFGERLRRHFCPTCGAALSITLDRFPAIRSIMGGTLDDTSLVKPAFSIWCSEAQPWVELPAHLVCFADYPDGTFA
ncbi:MAG: GFA family protein [Gammaproteobacteria bacterium]